MTSRTEKRSIAIIGSFRTKNYEGVQRLVEAFSPLARITSPKGSQIVAGVEFVRFATDDISETDELVQSRTLELIFAADAVYVAAPGGYVGRTTCYEIGRIIQRRQPIYFSSKPGDLPVHIPQSAVVAPDDFMIRFLANGEQFNWLFAQGEGLQFDVERRIASPK